MKTRKWLVAVGLFSALALVTGGYVLAQNIPPPNWWHPCQKAVNAIQVHDAQHNFNCSPLATINPTTGAVVFAGLPTQDPGICGALYTSGEGVVLINTSGCIR
jgi:hypothetical protein